MAEAPMRVKKGGLARYSAGGAALLALGVLALMPALATLKGCDDKAGDKVQPVKINGEWFHLEVAADDPTRMKGLGQRDFISDDGGMLFVFPQVQRADPRSGFVMRDCPVDIDIIFLDRNGRVGNWHAMKAEEKRRPDEGKVGEFGDTPEAQKYEARLKKYPARYDYQFVIELKGGTLERLKGKIKEGDKIDLPVEDLKKRAS